MDSPFIEKFNNDNSRTPDISTRNDSIIINMHYKAKILKKNITLIIPENEIDNNNFKKFKKHLNSKPSILKKIKTIKISESERESDKLSNTENKNYISSYSKNEKNSKNLQKFETRDLNRLGTIHSHNESEGPETYENRNILNKLIYLYDNEANKIKILKQDLIKSRNRLNISNIIVDTDTQKDENIYEKIDEKIENRKYELIKKSLHYTLTNIENKLDNNTGRKKTKDHFFFLRHMLKDKVCDLLFLKIDNDQDMSFNKQLDEAKINQPFREHILKNNFDQYSLLYDRIIMRQFLDREIDDRRETSPSLKLPKCLVSPSAKRDSIYRCKIKNRKKMSVLMHPSHFGDANIIYYNRNLVYDRNLSLSDDNNTEIILKNDESSVFSEKDDACPGK
jgi:hypothetical protein